MHKMLNKVAVMAVGVLTTAAGLGLWTAAPAAHADAINICADPTLSNVGDECCDGKGTVTLGVDGLICLKAL